MSSDGAEYISSSTILKNNEVSELYFTISNFGYFHSTTIRHYSVIPLNLGLLMGKKNTFCLCLALNSEFSIILKGEKRIYQMWCCYILSYCHWIHTIIESNIFVRFLKK